MTADRPYRHSLRRIAFASAILAGPVGPLIMFSVGAVGAQDAPNPSLVLSFGSSLSSNDNQELDPVSAGTTNRFDNSIGLAYLSETATSALQIQAGTVLRFFDSPTSTETGFDDPRLRLSYTRSGTNSLLSFSASQVNSRVAFFDPLSLNDDVSDDLDPVPVDSGDLNTSGDGTRADSTLSFRFQTGIGRPLGLSLAFSRRERDFSDTTDPDQFDTTTDSLALGASFRISNRTEADLTLSRSDFSAEDAPLTERQSDQISLGINHALTPALTLRFSLGQSRVTLDETVAGVRSTRSTEGVNGNLALTRELANGTIALVATREISIDGGRTEVTLNRQFDLPTGSLDLTFGTSQSEGGEATWIGSVNYRQDLARGRLSATLDRRVGINDVDDAITTTQARLGWSQNLTVRSNLDLSLDYLDVSGDTAGDDRSRTRLSIAYTWDLTEDWQMAGGYSRIQSTDETDGDAESNAVFLSLQRSFTFAP